MAHGSMTLTRYKTLVTTLDGQLLQTMKQRRQFRLHVLETGLAIAPSSSGKQRFLAWSAVARVLGRFEQTGSSAPVDYRDLTFDAS